MRCYCCNKSLTDFESVLRHPVTMEFLDICSKCLKDIPINPVEPASEIDDVDYDDIEELFYREDDSDS